MSLQLPSSPLGSGHLGGTWVRKQKHQHQVPDLPQLGLAVQSHQADSQLFALLIWIPFNGYQITPPWWLWCCCCPQPVAVQMARQQGCLYSRNTGILFEKELWMGQGCKASVTQLFPPFCTCRVWAGRSNPWWEVSWWRLYQCFAVNPKLWILPVRQLTGSVGKGRVRIRCNAESLLLLLCKIKPLRISLELNLSFWFKTMQMWHMGTWVSAGLVGGLAGLRGLFQP